VTIIVDYQNNEIIIREPNSEDILRDWSRILWEGTKVLLLDQCAEGRNQETPRNSMIEFQCQRIPMLRMILVKTSKFQNI
jgi:hypothetical protein